MSPFLHHLVSLFDYNAFFLFCALVGAGMVVIEFVMNLFGLMNGESFSERDVCIDKKLNVVSLQAVAGFLMMFGLVALACLHELHLDKLSSILVAFVMGILSVVVFNLIFKFAKKLQSSGSKFNVENVIGKEANVYQRIPKDGAGKISILFEDLTYEIDAVSHTQNEIPSFTRVQIIKKWDDLTVVVIPV